jgi:multicomponent Na+:H+ antiporter subunit F
MVIVDVTLAALAVALLLAIVRVAIGPTLADRVVAGELALVTFVGGIALLAVRLDSSHFLDVVVLAALLQFIATIALAWMLEQEEG